MSDKRYIVVAPTRDGSYAQHFGWVVEDTRPASVEFRRPWTGGERAMRTTARALNRRESEERAA